MGQTIELIADDGHKLSAYTADPVVGAKGGIVVIQEIFIFLRETCRFFLKFESGPFAMFSDISCHQPSQGKDRG